MHPNLPEDNNGIDRVPRLFIVVKRYEIDDEGHNFVVGTDLLEKIPGEIKVRLNTVDERAIDKPKENRAKIGQQYGNGITSRDTLADKAKSKASVLVFDELVAINDNKSYRAHWLTTLSSVDKPAHIMISPIAHIELKQETEKSTAKAFIESIQNNIKLNNLPSINDLDKAFISALNPSNKNNCPQRPFAILNLRYNNAPIFALLPRIYPSMRSKTIVDPVTFYEKKVTIPASGEETMKDILSGRRKGNNGREIFALDLLRASYAALANKGICKIFSEGENKKYVERVYKGIQNGKIEISLGSGLSINFGPASAKKYLADSEKKYLSLYNLKREVGDSEDNKFVRNVNGYASIVLALHQFNDGTYYVVNAISEDPYPKTKALNEIDLVQCNNTKLIDSFEEPKILDNSLKNNFAMAKESLNSNCLSNPKAEFEDSHYKDNYSHENKEINSMAVDENYPPLPNDYAINDDSQYFL